MAVIRADCPETIFGFEQPTFFAPHFTTTPSVCKAQPLFLHQPIHQPREKHRNNYTGFTDLSGFYKAPYFLSKILTTRNI
jgi:hypothetical protein